MKNYFKNKIKERLNYCQKYKNSVDIYWASNEIAKKTNEEYYRSKPLLKLILNVYFIPWNMIKFFSYLRIVHEYKKNQIEIKVLNKELSDFENK